MIFVKTLASNNLINKVTSRSNDDHSYDNNNNDLFVGRFAYERALDLFLVGTISVICCKKERRLHR